MLKSLTLSVSLAFALGACGVSYAGGHGKSMPSPQGPIEQGPIATEQVLPSEQCETGCAPACAPKKRCFLAGLKKMCTPKPKCYTYTWVLKKKRCGGMFGFGHKHNSGCGGGGCGEEGVYPTGQMASPQVEPTGQSWNGGYGSGQSYGGYGSGQSYGGYGSGQSYGGGTMAPAAPATGTAPAGDEAPAAPTPPTTSLGVPSPNATAGLLNLAPAGE